MTSSERNPDAVAYSVEGALKAVTHRVFSPERSILTIAAGENLSTWNDRVGRTQDDALDLIDTVLSFLGGTHHDARHG